MFNFIDLIIVILIVLCVVVGAWRGLIGSVAKMLGGVIRVIFSILLAKPFVSLISLTKLDEHMFDKLVNKFSLYSEKFNVNLVGMEEQELNVFIGDALQDAKIPRVFRSLFQNLFSITPQQLAVRESVTIAELMGVAVGNIIMLIGSFLFLVVLFWIISKLTLRWSKRVNRHNTVFAKTNKWLGAVFGLVKSLLIIFIVFIVISALSGFGFMEKIVTYVNSSFLGKLFFKISKGLIDSSFNIRETIQLWLNN